MGFSDRKLKEKSNIFFTIVKLGFLLWILYIWFFYYTYNSFKSEPLIVETKRITIEKWDNIYDVWEEIWLNKLFLKIYLKYNKKDFELLVWDFVIKKDSNLDDIFKSLEHPILAEEVDITLLEWWNIYDIDDYLTNNWYINKDEYINYVTSSQKIEQLSEFFPFVKWLKTLEWFLYSDTYRVNSNNLKINNLVISQLENFEKKVYKELLTKYDNKKIEEIVNLASIVEKEERNSNNKPTVAWILKKRLNEWWMIWADATVCYPHKLTSEECKMVVTKYIQEKSEYNTRTMIWLPKTPIWNPTYDTINATINSKETPYYYYLHDIKTWKIYYWVTNNDHEKNKITVQ